MTREPGQPPRQPRTPDIEDAPNPEHWSWDDLRTRIIDAATGIETGICAFNELPKTIQLAGILQERMLEIQQYTRDTNKERGFDIVVDPGTKRLLLEKKHRLQEGIIEREDGEISQYINGQLTPWALSDAFRNLSASEKERIDEVIIRMATVPDIQQRYNRVTTTKDGQLFRSHYRHSVGIAHSHPRRTPFSAEDLIVSLDASVRRFFPLIDDSGLTTVLVSTHETKYVNSTAELTSLYESLVKLGNNLLQSMREERINNPRKAEEILLSAQARLSDKYSNIREMIHYETDFRAQRERVRLFANERKLGYYEGRDGILTRVV